MVGLVQKAGRAKTAGHDIQIPSPSQKTEFFLKDS
jgi:hypothetical protein